MNLSDQERLMLEMLADEMEERGGKVAEVLRRCARTDGKSWTGNLVRFVGGPVDGSLRSVEPEKLFYTVPVRVSPPTYRLAESLDIAAPDYRMVEYRRERVQHPQGASFFVYVCTELPGVDQRDMLPGWRNR